MSNYNYEEICRCGHFAKDHTGDHIGHHVRMKTSVETNNKLAKISNIVGGSFDDVISRIADFYIERHALE